MYLRKLVLGTLLRVTFLDACPMVHVHDVPRSYDSHSESYLDLQHAREIRRRPRALVIGRRRRRGWRGAGVGARERLGRRPDVLAPAPPDARLAGKPRRAVLVEAEAGHRTAVAGVRALQAEQRGREHEAAVVHARAGSKDSDLPRLRPRHAGPGGGAVGGGRLGVDQRAREPVSELGAPARRAPAGPGARHPPAGRRACRRGGLGEVVELVHDDAGGGYRGDGLSCSEAGVDLGGDGGRRIGRRIGGGGGRRC